MLVHNFTGIIKVMIKPHNIHSFYSYGHDHYCKNLNNHWCLYLALICVVSKRSQQYALEKYTNHELHLTQIFHEETLFMMLGCITRLVSLCKGVLK